VVHMAGLFAAVHRHGFSAWHLRPGCEQRKGPPPLKFRPIAGKGTATCSLVSPRHVLTPCASSPRQKTWRIALSFSREPGRDPEKFEEKGCGVEQRRRRTGRDDPRDRGASHRCFGAFSEWKRAGWHQRRRKSYRRGDIPTAGHCPFLCPKARSSL
jgi:hypothetical protein